MRRPQASPTRNDEIGDELALSGRHPGDEVRADDLAGLVARKLADVVEGYGDLVGNEVVPAQAFEIARPHRPSRR